MPFYVDTLRYILDERGVDISAAAALGGMSETNFSKVLDGGHIPSLGQINRLTDRLAVPAYAFFSKNFKIERSEITDFRTKETGPLKYGRNARAFKKNIDLRNFLAEIFTRIDLDAPTELSSIDLDQNPEQLAAAFRIQLKLDEIQFESTSKKEFLRKFRRSAESLGIFVVQDQNISQDIDGFAIYHKNFTSNYIFLNSLSRNEGARSFTLAHELAHILGKRSAISNNYEIDNDVEAYCNAFAASLLVPRNVFIHRVEQRRLSFNSYPNAISAARELAEYFKTSLSTILIRARQVGLTKEDHYAEFRKGFGNPEYLDTDKVRQGGGSKDGPEPGVVDRAYLGDRAVAVIVKALREKVTTPYEIFERTGLSKRRIEGLRIVSDKEGISIK